MSQIAMLDAVHRSLKQNPVTLEQIWMDHAQVWQQLGWSSSQLKLWLACQPNIHMNTPSNGEQTYRIDTLTNRDEIDLADELVALLEKAGRPMPLAQLLGKLPAGWVVTEPMLRAVAQQDPRLELKGPLIKLA
jgi:hypothetical protein